MYQYQETNHPHSLCDTIDASEWKTVSKHRTLRGAARAYRNGLAEMRRRCGPSSWDCDIQVIDPAGQPVAYDVMMRAMLDLN